LIDLGERHRLALLFTDLSGSSLIGESIEAEVYAALLQQLRRIWHAVSARHGGRVVRAQGDGALITWGYPDVAEDDGRRAVEAALEIHAAVGRLAPPEVPGRFLPLAVHSGVHVGTVVIAPGDLELGHFDLVGDAVNTAARLAALALRGELLVSKEALGPYVQFFECEPFEAREIAGRATLLRVARVQGRHSALRGVDPRALRARTPFTGRAAVLGALHAHLAATPQNTSAEPFVIVGDAGIGKTRTLEEVASALETGGSAVLWGRCENQLGGEVLQPFAQMLRDLLHTLAAKQAGSDAMAAASGARLTGAMRGMERWIAPLQPAFAPEAASATAANPADLIGALLAFLGELASRTEGLVLLLDDWHWADDASRQLLEALLRQHPSILAVVARRSVDDDAPGGGVDGARIELQPFSENESVEIVRRWLPGADPFVAADIHAYAGGVPLYIEELCHHVAADGAWRLPDGRRPMQTWIASLVAARLARLAPPLARTVRISAVIGNVVPLGWLQSVIGSAAGELHITELAHADFVYPDVRAGMLRFKHGITRDAVYESIGRPERIQLHERIVEVLLAQASHTDAEEAVEALAHHCRAAGQWERSVDFAERAGDRAMAASAPDRARASYLAGMEALDQLPAPGRAQRLRWCRLCNKLGMASIFDPLALRGDLAPFERAVALARDLDDTDAQARAWYWLAYGCYGAGRFREGVRHARQALAQSAGEPRLRAQIEATLGQMLAATCAYGESIAFIDAALSSKRRSSRTGGGVAIGSAYSLACKGSVLADRGSFAAAHVCFGEAIELLGESTHPVGNSVRNWMAVACVWQGLWPQAARIGAESARIAEHTRALLLLSVVRSVSGYAAWAEQGDAGGLAQLREAVGWMESRAGAFFTSLQYGWLVEASIATGNLAEARRHAARLFQRAAQGERIGEGVGCRALAVAAAEAGDAAMARRWMARARRSARQRESEREAALNLAADARIATLQGDAAGALATHERAVSALRGLGMHWHAARLTA
jgi:class 3 adenylate cyclase/tetratricopeptide (TPR) repeat protein